MNRMLTSALASPSSSFKETVQTAWQADTQIAERRAAQAGAPCLFAPLHYEPGYRYPLLVWLHSAESSEYELRNVMPNVSLRNHVGVAPRGTQAVAGERNVFTWRQSAQHVDRAADLVDEAIRHANASRNIHEDRVFIAGYGVGGTMALRLALRNPEQFAGAVSFNGPMPRGGRPLGRINEARNLPLFMATCLHGEQFSPDRVCKDVRLVHTAGLKLNVHQYPCADQLTDAMLSDANAWMMKQFSSAATVIA